MKYMTELEIKEAVKNQIAKLRPLVKEAMTAVDRFTSSPSIKNGSMKQEAQDRLSDAIQTIALAIWDMWSEEFDDAITSVEYGALVDQVIEETDFDPTEDKIWLKFAGKSI